MNNHAIRIAEALERFMLMNHQPAVDEPSNDFERAVNEWYMLKLLQDELKSLMKPLNNDEQKARTELADSLKAYFADNLKEGVNSYALSNGRKLKLGNKIDCKIEAPMIPAARSAYNALDGGGSVTFDDLLRVKYELDKRNWDKLSPESATAVSRMLVTKPAMSTLEVD